MIKQQTNIYESSTVESSTYDFKEIELYVSFKGNSVYLYQNVSPEIYESFRDADSQGKALNSLIKKNEDITFEKLEDI